jgi:hypothetical protein
MLASGSLVFHEMASKDLFQEMQAKDDTIMRGPPLSQAYRHSLGMVALVPHILCPKPSDQLGRL